MENMEYKTIIVTDIDTGEVFQTSIKAEAKRIVFAVLRDTLCNLCFEDNATLDDYNEELQSNIVYMTMQDFHAGRYNAGHYDDALIAFRIISVAADYLWRLENRKASV